MSRFALRRAVAVACACSAAASGGYMLAAQTPAGAQAPGQTGQTKTGPDGSKPTSRPCVALKPDAPKPNRSTDPAATDAERVAIEQFAADLGVTADRLDAASQALKQQQVAPDDPRAAAILAQQLGLDPSVVQAALARMLAKSNHADARSANAKTARLHHAAARKAQNGTCPDPILDANNPKAVAIRNLAQDLGVTLPQLMTAFQTAESHGVHDLTDPRMAAALASALGKDPAPVRQALGKILSEPPFNQTPARAARR